MVNVEAGREIGFMLTYEELLRRQLGKYEHAVSLRPGQIVRNLSVEVTISERTGIDYIKVLPLRTSRLMTNTVRGETKIPPSTLVEKGPHCARVTFSPSPAEQAAQSSSGIAADFVIQYDVALKDLAGDVQIYNGYFVHYFAPRGLPTIQKNVIFVIDVSGSMTGTKIKQTKSAMHVILGDLHRNDFFNIITFSDVVQVWKPGHSIQATAQNIKSAKEYINSIQANGWTDINAALMAAASVLNKTSPKPEKGGNKQRIPLIIFLTDGEATSGVTSTKRILDNSHKAMTGTISLFCLAFGDDADYNLMRRLSLENRGIARRIYEHSDATLQLKGFYDEIASPLLFDIELAYLGETTYNVTQTLFPNYFQGSDLVVTGKLKSGTKNLKVQLTAHDQKAQLSLDNDINIEDNATQASFGCSGNIDEIQWFVQRLWAYFTIQDLLQARVKANDTAARRLLTEKATNLSLKFNFVTPVTSLVIVKPEDHDDSTTKATTSATSTTTASSTTSTVTFTSTTVLKTKITTGPRVTKPFTKSVTPSPTSVTSTIRPTSPRTSISPVKGSKGHAGNAHGPTTHRTITLANEKNTMVMPTNNSVLTTLSDTYHNLPVTSSTTWLTHTTLPVATTKTKTDKSPSIILASIRPTSFSTVPVAEIKTELLPETASAPTDGTSMFVTEESAERSQDTTSSSLVTSSNPENPTSLRLLILSEELLHSAVTFPTYVEYLHPPPEYSPYPEILGTLDIQDMEIDISEDSYFDALSSGEAGILGFTPSVDGDPHFVVNLPSTHEKLCFTLDGRPGDILRLVSDSSSGIVVNGHLMHAPAKIGAENRIRTYLDVITIIINRPRANYVINVSLNNLTLTGENQLFLSFDRPVVLQKPQLTIKVSPSSNVTVWIGRNVELLILFHHFRHPTYLQLDHLGFYIMNGDGLSSNTRGLLGQFQDTHIEVTEKKQSNGLVVSAILTRNNQTAPATLAVKTIKDSTAPAHESQCWLVRHRDIEGILDGNYLSYVVSDLQEI